MIAELSNLADAPFDFDLLLAAERTRLVRLCARLSGDVDAAEDLAQETLAEAWRQRRKLVDPAGAARWLNAIARNVCLRWARSRGAEPAQDSRDAEQTMAADSLDVDLERDELAALLDRALALLPAETRDVLVQKYVDESPLAAIGERLGLSPNAVAVRLHRGRLAFRRVLTSDLRMEASAFGLVSDPTFAWQPTTMWCPICGEHRLQAAYDAEHKQYGVRCPACPSASGQPCVIFCCGPFEPPRNGRYRSALLRGMADADVITREAQRLRSAPCPECGATMPLRLKLPPDRPGPFGDRRGMLLECPRCDIGETISLRMFAQSQPAVRTFWKRHPRMRTLPTREVELAGIPAVVVAFESLGAPARIEVVTTRDTWEVLDVNDE